MNNSISDRLNQLIAQKYPEVEEKIRGYLGVKPQKSEEIKQISLDPKATIDGNLDSLASSINNPDTSADERVKALSAYNLILKKLQEQK